MLVIGIGNAYRSDDGAGLAVARRLKERAPANVTVLEQDGEGVRLMEAWKDARAVILIDAAHSGAAPGTIHHIDCRRDPLPPGMFGDSTHAFGVAEAVELGRVLGRLPARLILFGVEGADYRFGTELSPAVLEILPQVVAAILQEINR